MNADYDHVIDAARKWEEHCRTHKGQSFTHPEAIAEKSKMIKGAKEVLAKMKAERHPASGKAYKCAKCGGEIGFAGLGTCRECGRSEIERTTGNDPQAESCPEETEQKWRPLAKGEVVENGDQSWNGLEWTNDFVGIGSRVLSTDLFRRRIPETQWREPVKSSEPQRELLPCPFCGSEAEYIEHDGEYCKGGGVRCKNDWRGGCVLGGEVLDGFGNDRQNAVDAWNRRANSDPAESSPVKSSEPQRREWWIHEVPHVQWIDTRVGCRKIDGDIHVREVLPGDPDPAEIERLKAACVEMLRATHCGDQQFVGLLRDEQAEPMRRAVLHVEQALQQLDGDDVEPMNCCGERERLESENESLRQRVKAAEEYAKKQIKARWTSDTEDYIVCDLLNEIITKLRGGE